MPTKGENITEEKIVRGILSLYILKEIFISRCHGYDLQQKIENKAGIELPPGTIYVLLKNLRERGFLSVEKEINERGQEIVVYSLTEEGIAFLRSHYKALKIARGMIDDLLMIMEKLQ